VSAFLPAVSISGGICWLLDYIPRRRGPSLVLQAFPWSNTAMKRPLITVLLLLITLSLHAQTAAPSVPNYSGTYSFLKEGEFVQITVEEAGKVTGFISRFGDVDNERDAFLDHFFKDGKLTATKLTFSTQTVHGVWFDFSGNFDRGEGKNPGDEAYYVLKGTLVRNSTDANKKVTAKSMDVVFKSFPEDMQQAK
jgi:hypothetical protein